MSRYHREPAVIEAAARWRDRCLLDDGSVLSETKRLWSLENLVHLERHFVDNPDDGEGGFFDKLEEQLSPAPAAAKQLAAELLWLLYLGVSEGAIRGGTKRLQIRRVWEWSGETLPDAPRELEALDRGIANPGTAYQAQRWREFRFAIQLMRDWKRLPEPKRRALIADAWEFGAWVDAQTYAAGRQLRHFLLTMLFPEHYERIVSDQHKQKILKTFPSRLGDAAVEVDYKDRLSVDRTLYQLRERLETEYDAIRWTTTWNRSAPSGSQRSGTGTARAAARERRVVSGAFRGRPRLADRAGPGCPRLARVPGERDRCDRVGWPAR
jgi:5-methylcytosine-specific restriction enzyme B